MAERRQGAGLGNILGVERRVHLPVEEAAGGAGPGLTLGIIGMKFTNAGDQVVLVVEIDQRFRRQQLVKSAGTMGELQDTVAGQLGHAG